MAVTEKLLKTLGDAGQPPVLLLPSDSLGKNSNHINYPNYKGEN